MRLSIGSNVGASAGVATLSCYGQGKLECANQFNRAPPSPVRAKRLGLAASGSNWTDDFEREGNRRNLEYVAVPRNQRAFPVSDFREPRNHPN